MKNLFKSLFLSIFLLGLIGNTYAQPKDRPMHLTIGAMTITTTLCSSSEICFQVSANVGAEGETDASTSGCIIEGELQIQIDGVLYNLSYVEADDIVTFDYCFTPTEASQTLFISCVLYNDASCSGTMEQSDADGCFVTVDDLCNAWTP